MPENKLRPNFDRLDESAAIIHYSMNVLSWILEGHAETMGIPQRTAHRWKKLFFESRNFMRLMDSDYDAACIGSLCDEKAMPNYDDWRKRQPKEPATATGGAAINERASGGERRTTN